MSERMAYLTTAPLLLDRSLPFRLVSWGDPDVVHQPFDAGNLASRLRLFARDRGRGRRSLESYGPAPCAHGDMKGIDPDLRNERRLHAHGELGIVDLRWKRAQRQWNRRQRARRGRRSRRAIALALTCDATGEHDGDGDGAGAAQRVHGN